MVALTLLAVILSTGGENVHARADMDTAQYILALKPGLGVKKATRLGKIIDYWASRYEVSADLMVAIIRQESNFEPVKACWPAPWRGTGAITCDHGLAQVNQTWIEKWQLDPVKLVSDDSYNIYVQARILAWIKRYYGQEYAWFARYHSATPSKRREYLGKIEVFLALK